MAQGLPARVISYHSMRAPAGACMVLAYIAVAYYIAGIFQGDPFIH